MFHHLQEITKLIFRRPLVCTTIIPRYGDGRIVLVQRRDDRQWSLPGGLVDWGETVEQGAARELQEETALQVVAIERLVGVYSHPQRDPRSHVISIVLAAQVVGEFRNNAPKEIMDIKAFLPDNLPTGGLSHDHDLHLQDYFQGLTTVA